MMLISSGDALAQAPNDPIMCVFNPLSIAYETRWFNKKTAVYAAFRVYIKSCAPGPIGMFRK